MMSDKEYNDFWDRVRNGTTGFTRFDQYHFNFKIGKVVRDLQRRVEDLESLINKESV